MLLNSRIMLCRLEGVVLVGFVSLQRSLGSPFIAVAKSKMTKVLAQNPSIIGGASDGPGATFDIQFDSIHRWHHCQLYKQRFNQFIWYPAASIRLRCASGPTEWPRSHAFHAARMLEVQHREQLLGTRLICPEDRNLHSIRLCVVSTRVSTVSAGLGLAFDHGRDRSVLLRDLGGTSRNLQGHWLALSVTLSLRAVLRTGFTFTSLSWPL